MKIVLASASPRRRELLSSLGVDYTVLASGVEEKVTETEPYKVVEQLSAQKAGDVLQKLLTAAGENPDAPIWDGGGDLLVIGADTIVALDGRILGKPADEGDGALFMSVPRYIFLPWLRRRSIGIYPQGNPWIRREPMVFRDWAAGL